MNTSTTEETGAAPATATDEQPKPTKKARVASQRAHVATAKAKSAHKAAMSAKGKQGKRAAKQPPKDREKPAPAREGTKTAKVLALLKRSGGATAKELMKATSWQAHSVRGFVSGTLGKRMGLAVESTKREDGERQYRIAH